MSAPNFSCNPNSNYIYAFCDYSDFEDYKKELQNDDPEYYEENQDYLEGDFAYSDWYENEKDYYLTWLEEALNEAAAGKSNINIDFIDLAKTNVYDGTELATVTNNFVFAGIDFSVKLSINFEAGYYAGFAIDWNYSELLDSFDGKPDDLDDEDYSEALRDYRYYYNKYYGLNPGLAKALAPKLRKRTEKAISEAAEVIENALQKVAPYHLTGFCIDNGEGIYSDHKNKAA